MELEKLRELDSLKSRFFADISHELRTPLTLIVAPVNQMLAEADKPRILQKLHLVRNNAEYLLRLIGQILDFSKLEARRMRLQASIGDLVQCVETSVASFAPVAEAKGIELSFHSTYDLRTDRPEETCFDRDVLEKILNNVVGNALKFTPHGGTVSVSLASGTDGGERGPYAEIVVSDTGVGIPTDRLPHIFDRFYQVDGTRSREGIGIGLALVKELVELHYGTIRVESVDGEGTTFVVRMPTSKARLEPRRDRPGAAGRRPRTLAASIERRRRTKRRSLRSHSRSRASPRKTPRSSSSKTTLACGSSCGNSSSRTTACSKRRTGPKGSSWRCRRSRTSC